MNRMNRIKKLEKLLKEDKKIIVIWDEDENNYTDKQIKEAELIIRVEWGGSEEDEWKG